MIFEFAYAWYEDYEPHLFEGPEKTQEEWQDECEQAMRDVGEQLIQSSEENELYVGVPEWVKAACTKLEERGYKRLKPVKYEIWGSCIVREDSEGKRLSNIVGEVLFKKAVERNKQVQAELYSEDHNA